MKIFLGLMMVLWTAMMFDEKASTYFKTYALCYVFTVIAFILCSIFG